MKKLLILFMLLLISALSYSQLIKQNEAYYQKSFGDTLKSRIPLSERNTVLIEVPLPDQTRADIVTSNFAIEVEFASKWKNSIGQALHYTKIYDDLGVYKKGGVVLIVNGTKENNYNNSKDGYFLQSLIDNAYKLNISVWTIDYNTNKWKKLKLRVVYE